jgi:hypothetical protein
VNDALMQFQSDLIGAAVVRPRVTETTALGAAALAGLAVGFWKGPPEIAEARGKGPDLPPEARPGRAQGHARVWSRAVGDRAPLVRAGDLNTWVPCKRAWSPSSLPSCPSGFPPGSFPASRTLPRGACRGCGTA